MNILQQHHSYSQPQQFSKHIDPDKIYPKRLGTYQNGNALVLEYYNLATDKFKKHVIPLDHTKNAKENLDAIYKNPKHSILLRKVQPKYVQNVLKGQSVMGQQRQHSSKQSFSQPSYSERSNQNSYLPSYPQRPSPQFSQQTSYSQQQELTPSGVNTYKESYQQDSSEVSSIVDNRPGSHFSSEVQQKIEEVEEYYDEEFEEFEISQSMGKKNAGSKINNNTTQPKKQSVADLSLNSNQGNQSVSIPLQSKYNHEEDKEKDQKKEKKQKKSKKSKDGKKSKKKNQQPQQAEFQFDFLDGEGEQVKPKASKQARTKESSKQKTKSKEKSKQKSTKKEKKDQKPKASVETVIEQDFDFDL